MVITVHTKKNLGILNTNKHLKYVFVEYTSLVSEINRVSPFVAEPHQTPPLKKTNLEFTQFKKKCRNYLGNAYGSKDTPKKRSRGVNLSTIDIIFWMVLIITPF